LKFIDEFRDPRKARALLGAIQRIVPEIERQPDRPLQIMEVCGGHTHTIYRYGLEQLLPDGIELVHGPGCPVCVLPMGRVDDCVALARRPEVILATFGDAMRVPGSKGSLLQAKAEGADVRVVYSPLDALALARSHPDREVVFFGLGFEPLDILQSLLMVLRQLRDGRATVENQYSRVVGTAGNAAALRAIERVYELRAHFEWRGLGSIEQSGVQIREPYGRFDAERRFPVPALRVVDPDVCRCGDVLKGRIRPQGCAVFGKACTPETPLGALMVSSEGACAALYQYGRSVAPESA